MNILSLIRSRGLALAGSRLVTKYRTHLGVAAGTLLLAGLLMATGPEAIPEETTEKAWPITVIEANPAWMQPAFTAFGRFEARREATLSSDLLVRIAEVVVSEGDEVIEGDALIRLDAADLERRMREAEATWIIARSNLASVKSEMALANRTREDYAALHEAAQAKLERHRGLLERRLVSQVLFDEVASQAAEASIRNQNQLRLIDDLPNRLAQADAGVNSALAVLEQARADLDETVIRAPFSGPVLAVNAAPGEMNVPGTALVELSARDSYELRLEIPERFASRIEESLLRGQAVTATTMDPATATKGRYHLTRIGRQVREGRGGIDAFFVAASPDRTAALLGRVTDAQVALPAEANLLALPPESLFENSRVYQVVNQRLEAIPVERVGESTINGRYRLLVRGKGIPEGASILATQLPQAVTGLLVAPISTPETKSQDGSDLANTNTPETARGTATRTLLI
jgi:multidrug efflux pump subunit AcrA (membrane-fusion protein)